MFRHPQVLDEFPGAVLGTLPVCVNDVGRRIRRIAVLNSGGAFQVLGVDDRDFRGRVGGGAESRGRIAPVRPGVAAGAERELVIDPDFGQQRVQILAAFDADLIGLPAADVIELDARFLNACNLSVMSSRVPMLNTPT